MPSALRHAAFTILCHRQHPASPAAASARIERLAEAIEAAAETGTDLGVAVIGNEPFDAAEIGDHVAPGNPRWDIALDPLAAAVLAGRPGVSARRFARLPLIRSTRRIATDLVAFLDAPTTSDAGSTSDATVARSIASSGEGAMR